MTKRRACPFASRAYSWRSNQSINTTSSKPRAVWEIHLGLDTGNKWDSCWAGHIRARGPRSSSVGLVVVYWCTGVFHEASLSLTGPRGPRPGIHRQRVGPHETAAFARERARSRERRDSFFCSKVETRGGRRRDVAPRHAACASRERGRGATPRQRASPMPRAAGSPRLTRQANYNYYCSTLY